MKIIVDTMGSDKGPDELVQGALDAVSEYDIEVILVGDELAIKSKLKGSDYDRDRVKIVGTTDLITNEDDPVRAIRRKKDASMVVAANLLSEGKADGMISTGNTGGLLAAGLFIVGRIPGIDRAAISVLYPTINGFSLLLDSGANVDARPEMLEQFALMGSIYMERIMEKANPTVGLINIGVEEAKGNKLTKDTYKLLEKTDLNFVGNVEARDLPKGQVDVLIADGFVGNIVLKLTEGMAISIMAMLKEKFMKNLKTKLAAGLLKSELVELKEFMDYREYGGAPLLGIKKPMVKAHGSSDSLAFKNGIKQLIDFINRDIINTIEKELIKEGNNNVSSK